MPASATWNRVSVGLFSSILTVALSAPIAAQDRYTAADLEEGASYFMNSCADCHGPDGNVIPGIELGRPSLPRGDEDLERIMLNGIPGTPMPPSSLNRRQVDTIIGYIRSLDQSRGTQPLPGDVASGRAIVEGTGGCLNCHSINGRGSRTGPDLSKIGIQRRAENLRRSLIDPNAEIRSENRYVRVVTRNGDSIRGRILNQNTDSVQLRGPDDRPVSFAKQALESIELEDTSPMPSFADRISEDELSDVLAYLLSLRGME